MGGPRRAGETALPERPIDEWTLEDLFDNLDVLRARAARAPAFLDRATATGEDALNVAAWSVVEGLADGSAEERLIENLRVAAIRGRTAAERTQTVTYVGTQFGAKCQKLIRWLKYKGALGATYTKPGVEVKKT